MKKIKRKHQKENIIPENGLKTNYYELMKSFVLGIETNPIKIPANVKEKLMIAFLERLLKEVSRSTSVEDASSSAT